MPFRDWWGSTIYSPLRTETLLTIAVVALVVLRAALHRSRLGRRLDTGLTILVIALVALALVTGAGAAGAVAAVPYARAVFAAALAIALVRIALILLVDVYLRERSNCGSRRSSATSPAWPPTFSSCWWCCAPRSTSTSPLSSPPRPC
jgi:hypothetical protein